MKEPSVLGANSSFLASTTYDYSRASRQERIVRVQLRRKSNRKDDNTIIGKSSRINTNDNLDKE